MSRERRGVDRRDEGEGVRRDEGDFDRCAGGVFDRRAGGEGDRLDEGDFDRRDKGSSWVDVCLEREDLLSDDVTCRRRVDS